MNRFIRCCNLRWVERGDVCAGWDFCKSRSWSLRCLYSNALTFSRAFSKINQSDRDRQWMKYETKLMQNRLLLNQMSWFLQNSFQNTANHSSFYAIDSLSWYGLINPKDFRNDFCRILTKPLIFEPEEWDFITQFMFDRLATCGYGAPKSNSPLHWCRFMGSEIKHDRPLAPPRSPYYPAQGLIDGYFHNGFSRIGSVGRCLRSCRIQRPVDEIRPLVQGD